MSTHTTCAVLSAVNTAADTAHFVYRLHWSPLWVEKSALACYVNLIVDLMCFWRYPQNLMFTATEGTTNVPLVLMGTLKGLWGSNMQHTAVTLLKMS
jgi:hypothetical protein